MKWLKDYTKSFFKFKIICPRIAEIYANNVSAVIRVFSPSFAGNNLSFVALQIYEKIQF